MNECIFGSVRCSMKAMKAVMAMIVMLQTNVFILCTVRCSIKTMVAMMVMLWIYISEVHLDAV